MDQIFAWVWLVGALVIVIGAFIGFACWAGSDAGLLSKAQREYQRRARLRGKYWV